MKYILAFLLFFIVGSAAGQVNPDSIVIKSMQELMTTHPYFNVDGVPLQLSVEERKETSSESLFYFVVGLVLYLALMRLIFYKYVSTMFTLFFRATLRQQQLREQMLQAPLPALLMNIFFVVVFAAYSVLLARHFRLPIADHFPTAMMYGTALVAIIYVGKFLLLKIIGWIFGITNATDTYLFIVFLVNKMIGVFLVPFIALIAFPTKGLAPAVVSISYLIVAALFIYRFIVSYRPLRSEIKLSRLQFFLYLCAFEIAPLLLIYKVLLASEVSSL